MNTQEREVMKMALDALKEIHVGNMTPMAEINWNKAITIIKEALAQPEHDCTRSHPHEDMGKECELRTEIARLTNQQAHRSQAQLQLKMTALERAWFLGYENDIESAMHNLREEIIKEALAQQSNEQVEPDWNDEQLKMLNFLYGAGDFDGVWFEQKHPTERGAFWWRKHLKRLFAHPPVPTAQPKEPEQGPNYNATSDERLMKMPEQEPVAFICQGNAYMADDVDEYCTATHIPLYTTPPQRKPLTDEQIYQMWTDEGLANSYDIYSLKEHVRRAARAIEAAHGIKGDA